MGGPKKPTLKQLEKRLLKQKQQAGKAVEVRDKSIAGVTPPSLDEVESFINTQPYITPYTLSEKFGTRISLSKDILKKLAERGKLRLVEGDHRLRIYAPIKLTVEERKEEKPKKRKK